MRLDLAKQATYRSRLAAADAGELADLREERAAERRSAKPPADLPAWAASLQGVAEAIAAETVEGHTTYGDGVRRVLDALRDQVEDWSADDLDPWLASRGISGRAATALKADGLELLRDLLVEDLRDEVEQVIRAAHRALP